MSVRQSAGNVGKYGNGENGVRRPHAFRCILNAIYCHTPRQTVQFKLVNWHIMLGIQITNVSENVSPFIMHFINLGHPKTHSP